MEERNPSANEGFLLECKGRSMVCDSYWIRRLQGNEQIFL